MKRYFTLLLLLTFAKGFTQNLPPLKWQTPLNHVDINNLAMLNDGSILCTAVNYQYLYGLLTKEMICLDPGSGIVKWRHASGTSIDFVPLITSPNLIGYYIHPSFGSEPNLVSFVSFDKRGEELWKQSITGSFRFSIINNDLLIWYSNADRWYLKTIALPSGESAQKEIQIEDAPLSSVVIDDKLFLFGRNRLTVYDSISHQSYNYPAQLNASASVAAKSKNGYVLFAGEMIFSWSKSNGLLPLTNNRNEVLNKYSVIGQFLKQAELSPDAIFNPDFRLESKGKKAQEQVIALTRAHQRLAKELTITNVAEGNQWFLSSHRSADGYTIRLIDTTPSIRHHEKIGSPVYSNLLEVGSDVYFTSREYLYKWDVSSGKLEPLIPISWLAQDAVEITLLNNQIVIHGKPGFIVYQYSTNEVVASQLAALGQTIPSGYFAHLESLAASKLNNSISTGVGQQVIHSSSRWRDQNVELQKQIQKEPYRREFLLNQMSINTTIGTSFEKVNTASDLLSANIGLMKKVEEMKDKDKLEQVQPMFKTAERVFQAEFTTRMNGNYYALPLRDEFWKLRVCNLRDLTYADIPYARYDELREVNEPVFPSYLVNSDNGTIVMKVDNNEKTYERIAYYQRPKGLNAATKANFPSIKIVSIKFTDLQWKKLELSPPQKIVWPDLSLIDAVKTHDLDLAREILESKQVDINNKDAFGMTAFLWAVAIDNPDMVDLILKYDPDGGVLDVNGWSAFTYLEIMSLGSPRSSPTKVTGKVKRDMKD